jgi:hypothetical protein
VEAAALEVVVAAGAVVEAGAVVWGFEVGGVVEGWVVEVADVPQAARTETTINSDESIKPGRVNFKSSPP